MLDWKATSKGDTALLIKGARRIGKSTIVEQFAQNEYKSYILIDFSNTSLALNNLFSDIYDLDLFFQRLELISKKELYRRQSVIIFDEVQLQPLARQAIKHLVKDGRYDYIETGSLLSIKKNIKDILIPSEEVALEMHPMDYEEFLWAIGNAKSMTYIRQAFDAKKPLGDNINRQLMRNFRLYMLVGGMPQAVKTYIDSKKFSEVDRIKRNILKLYEDDFRKIDGTGKAALFFKNIPAQLSSNASRYKISSVDKNSRAGRVAELLQDMLDSMTINIAYHSNDPSIGMALSKDIAKYKLFLADTGLFVTLAFMDKDFTENSIYEKLLSDKLPANLGYVFENMVAQMLRASGNQLFYHSFNDEIKANGKLNRKKYEIDFLLSRQNKLCPIEVKSSTYRTHKSLDAFVKKYSARVADKYLIYSKDYKKDKDITLLPIYMTMLL